MFGKRNNPNNDVTQARSGRRSFLKRGSIATGITALAATFGLTPSLPAYAESQSGQPKIQVQPLTGFKANQYIRHAFDAEDYQNFKKGVQQNYADVLTIDERGTTVTSITVENNSFVAVRVPIIDGIGHSAYTATFSQGSFMILATMSVLFRRVSEQDLHVVAARDGKVILDAVLAPDGTILHGTVYRLHGPQTLENVSPEAYIPPTGGGSNKFWKCMNNCLSALGIAATLFTVITIACEGACLAGVPVCIGCIVLQTGLAGAAVAWCVSGCW